MCQSGCDNLLTGICQHFHQRAHSVQMLLAPQGNLIITGYGKRALPQIQMISPFGRCRKFTGRNEDFEIKLLQQTGTVFYQQSTLVGSGSSRLRNPALHPDRLNGTCRNRHWFQVRINRVGYQQWIVIHCLTVTARASAIFIQFIGHYITDETGFKRLIRKTISFFISKIGKAEVQIFHLSAGPDNSLRVYTFATPAF